MTQVDERPALAGFERGSRQLVLAAVRSAFRDLAFHHVTLDVVAERAGLPLATVRQHFPTFDDLLLEVVEGWYSERLAPALPVAEQYGAVAFLRAMVVANLADPGLMRLLSSMVNIVSTPYHPLSPVLQQQWMRFHALVQRTLANDVARQREPETMDPARGAEQLIALYEGLKVQWMVRPAMDLLGAYDRGVTRLRNGWALSYTPPVWEI